MAAQEEIDTKSANEEKLQQESDIVCGYFQDNDSDATGDLSLDVLTRFHKIYEEKLKTIEQTDNSYQMQVSILKKWVNDLTEQNALLVHTVKELEKEATKRVHLLEERIVRDENKHLQVQEKMENEIRQQRQIIICKDNDLRCLIEVLRRLRESECLTLDDLHFYEITDSHIFGRPEGVDDDSANEWKIQKDSLQKENDLKDREIHNLIESVCAKEGMIEDLQEQLAHYTAVNYERKISKTDTAINTDKDDYVEKELVKERSEFMALKIKKRNVKISELKVIIQDYVDSLKSLKSRNEKNNIDIEALRKDCYTFEKQCQSLSMHGRFKDDIIRELRSQLKKSKSKIKNLSLQEYEQNPSGIACRDHAKQTPLRNIISKTSTCTVTSNYEQEKQEEPTRSFFRIDEKAEVHNEKADCDREDATLEPSESLVGNKKFTMQSAKSKYYMVKMGKIHSSNYDYV